MSKIRYFPEIDGLRAIAVLSVLIYHANISINEIKIFSGGFLGVDVFFVISGYLITSILLKDYKKNNKISIRFFYERRIRRIFPALLFVIFSCTTYVLGLARTILIGIIPALLVYSTSYGFLATLGSETSCSAF